ncbi:MAG: hypothetical protein ACHQJD_01990 [Thermoanaerobaculia bacterium]
MRESLKVFLCTLILGGLVTLGCTKKEGTAGTTAQSAAPAPAAAPAATTASPAPPAAGGSSVETTSKLAAVDWAIKQDAIKNDPDGQWAVSATASSTYGDAKGTANWSANQVTGLPNVDKYGDDGHAWAPKTPDGGIEWLDVKFPKPVHATEIRVRESCGSGAVIKVELFDEQGVAHTAWAGNDPTTELNYLIVKLPKTEYKTDRVKVTLATNVIPGWNEIDAIQLVGKDQ